MIVKSIIRDDFTLGRILTQQQAACLQCRIWRGVNILLACVHVSRRRDLIHEATF